MYKLTLTKSERDAMEFVGRRYAHGWDLFQILIDFIPEGQDWDDAGDITFVLPEHKGWEVADLLNESREGLHFSCFSDAFCLKLNRFCDSIV